MRRSVIRSFHESHVPSFPSSTCQVKWQLKYDYFAQTQVYFLKTRKTAGTSIEIALSKYCDCKDVITKILPLDEKIREGFGYPGPPKLRSAIWSVWPERLGKTDLSAETSRILQPHASGRNQALR